MKILIDIKLILLFHLIYQLQNVRSTSDESLPDIDYSQETSESAEPEPRHTHRHRHSRRSGHRHKKSRSRDHDHDRDNDDDHDHDHDRNHKHYNDDCECSCNKCDTPSDCCKSVCKSSCPGESQYGQSGQGPGQSQSSVVFVPYPYPMIVPNQPPPMKNGHGTMRAQSVDTTLEVPTTTTTTSTTTTTTTTTESPQETLPPSRLYLKSQNDNNYLKSQNDNSMLESVLKSVVDDYSNIIVKTPEKLKNGNSKYMLTSLRRTKPTWMPKFGIVPISDNIAEKLMSQLRNSRGMRRRQKRVATYNFFKKF